MSRIEIIPVETKKEKKQFILLPWKIYKGDPNWVPPLIIDQKELFDPKKHPFYTHSEAQLFLAIENNEPVGRIVAIHYKNHNAYYKDKVGFFGFFECINSKEVSRALFQAAQDWLKEKGLEKMRGPANYTVNEEYGLLIDDFNLPPVVMMTYNPKYYIDLYEDFGLEKIKGLYAYWVDKDSVRITDKMKHALEKIKSNKEITYRNVNLKDFKNEIEKVKKVYNSAWAENWGAVPMTDEEIDYVGKKLKMIADPRLIYFAEVDGKPVGFSLAVPDINQALIKINGRLLPFGLFKLLWYKRKINAIRVIIMGVIKEYRHRGIDAYFYYETIRNGIALGYRGAETSWILEDNIPMNRILQSINAKIYKRYAIYEKDI